MQIQARHFLHTALAASVALLAFLLISVFFQHTTARVIVKGHFYQDTRVVVSALSASNHSVALHELEFPASDNTDTQRQSTRQFNLPIKRLKLEFFPMEDTPAQAPYSVRLTGIEVIKPYMKHYHFNAEKIDAFFGSSSQSSSIVREFTFPATNLIDSNSSANGVDLYSKAPIADNNWALMLGIPFLFFFGVLFILKNSQWSRIPAFADMSLGNRISSSGEFDSINGVRGLAAILVLFSHTAPGFTAVQMGLAILFVISGFLLSKPFILDPTKIFSWSNIERYLTKRLKRILPMYYLYVFLMYVVTFKFDIALRHFFFVQAEGHLWPMTQIFAFYMLLPFVLLITCSLYKLNRFLPVIVLVIATYFAVIYARDWTPFYNGRFSNPFYLYAFLMGVIGAYIQYDWIGERWLKPTGARWRRELVSLAAIVFVFYAIAWSAPMRPSLAIFHWVSQFWLKSIASVLIIILALNTPATLFRSIIANPLFRSVGVIGFSFYILHGLGMNIFEQIQLQYLGDPTAGNKSWVFVSGAFVVTYVMAVIGYSYVERPFFGYRDKQKG